VANLLSSKVQVPSLVDVVTERLEAAIVSGELAPGTKISELGLANSLGVSRGPLREAIRRLEGRKLVERTRNVGVRIAQLSPGALVDLLYVREALEGMAARLAATRISDADIAALRALLDKHRRQIAERGDDGYYQESGDFDFHFRVARASGNEQLASMITGDLYDLLRVYRYKSSTRAGRTEQALAEHNAILEAIIARDPERADAAMRQHIAAARRALEENTEIGQGTAAS